MSATAAHTKPKNKEPPPQWRGDIDTLMKSSMSLLKAATPHMDKTLPKEQPVCYGRVKDLSAKVPPQWWKSVFADAMYLKTDGDVVEDPEITKGEIALLEAIPCVKEIFLRDSELEAGDDSPEQPESPARILDLCCGQGRHSLHLAKEYPHLFVHGHDQSSYLISLAQERASFQSVTSQTFFTVGDCRQIPYPDNTFDLVLIMGNSFGYFADEQGDRAVLGEVARVLAPGGRLVLDITDGDYMRENYAERSWEWVDDSTFVCRERQLSKDGLRLISREIITVANKGVVRDQFYQERLYSQAELATLIRESNLCLDAENAQEKTSDRIITIGYDLSKRKEDLGMMEQRTMVMATKPLPVQPLLDPTSALPDLVANSMTSPAESSGPPLQGACPAQKLHSVPTVEELVDGVSSCLAIDPTGPPPAFPLVSVILGDTSMGCFGKLNNTWNAEDIETRAKLVQALRSMGYADSQVKILDNHHDLLRHFSVHQDTFVFNLCDEGFFNDALKELHVPALLEAANVEYSGAGPNCLAYCYDKGLVNRTAEAMGVPTPAEITYLGDTSTPAVSDLNKLDQLIKDRILYPAFIKPVKGDNSLGITSRSIVRNRDELRAYTDELTAIGIRDVLVQEYLQGTEYGVGMVGNIESGFHFFPILEVDYTKIVEKNLPPILGFRVQVGPKQPVLDGYLVQARIMSPEVEKQLKKNCVVLWERFGFRDYGRFDFRCDVGTGTGKDGENGTIKLLEVNPNPGWCWDGKFAYMAKLDGLEYKDMLRMIIQAAWARITKKA